MQNRAAVSLMRISRARGSHGTNDPVNFNDFLRRSISGGELNSTLGVLDRISNNRGGSNLQLHEGRRSVTRLFAQL